jgi:hypothetical protein
LHRSSDDSRIEATRRARFAILLQLSTSGLENAILSQLNPRSSVQEATSSQPSTQRRRSERVVESLPIIVRGIDLLGQPFEERTATLAFNLQGCRYPSKYHLPKNTWVTLEIVRGARVHNVRARVAWVQRPHTVRELFQIAVELETYANIWEYDSAPEGWAAVEVESRSHGTHQAFAAAASFTPHENLKAARESEAGAAPNTLATIMERIMADKSHSPAESAELTQAPESFVERETSAESAQPADHPFVRDLGAELARDATQSIQAATREATEQIRLTAESLAEHRAAHAEESFQRWMTEFEQDQRNAREQFSGELTSRQQEFLSGLKSEFEENFSRARKTLDDLDHKAQAIRAESEAAVEATSRMAQARLTLEAAEASRTAPATAEPSREEIAAAENAAAEWRKQLESEMAVAQSQWNELLQSSLDGGIERLVAQMSERSQDLLRSAEQKITERFSAIQQPLAQASSEAGEHLNAVKSSLDAELSRARSSLAEIEHAASRMKEYSAQLEAASHDALNELHRRLEKILETQTDEMNRRFEILAAGVPQRVAPALDSLGHQFVERTVGEVESKLAPHLERVPQLVRELSSREVQAEDGLRLHRERLRQVSENNQREVAAQMSSTLSNLRGDFESARKEALAKWNEELDATGVRASHSAAESIGRTSEWFQQEARARLQVLVEQGLASAGNNLELKANEGAQKFSAQLEAQSTAHLAQIHERMEGVAVEVAGRSRTQLELAAEEAAASFGFVLRAISTEEISDFTAASRTALQERAKDLEVSANQILQTFESNAGTSLGNLQSQMAAQVEASAADGRRVLAEESTSALASYRVEASAHQKELASALDRMSLESAEKFKERLETTGDTWMISSVRRINEHGQNVIESLMRSADQSLRDSCSKFFEGLAASLRERTPFSSGASVFKPIPENPGSSGDSASSAPHA